MEVNCRLSLDMTGLEACTVAVPTADWTSRLKCSMPKVTRCSQHAVETG